MVILMEIIEGGVVDMEVDKVVDEMADMEVDMEVKIPNEELIDVTRLVILMEMKLGVVYMEVDKVAPPRGQIFN